MDRLLEVRNNSHQSQRKVPRSCRQYAARWFNVVQDYIDLGWAAVLLVSTMKENTTEFQPVGDNIQITLEGGQEKIGSIYLPQNMQKAPTVLAKVVAVGPLCKQIKAGQWAVVGVAQVLVLKLDGNDVAFTKEDRVMAVVDSRPAPLFTIVPEGKSKGSK